MLLIDENFLEKLKNFAFSVVNSQLLRKKKQQSHKNIKKYLNFC